MTVPKCPICDRSRAEGFKPFCSKRCAQRDLGNWLNEDYAIPAIEAPEDEENPVTLPDDEHFH